jgi:Conserved hypothetical ATP binding protein
MTWCSRTCSILYKTRLPFILVFNKTDVERHEFAVEWMNDFEAFQEALAARERQDADGEQTYMSSLMNSMSLVLDEFYKGLKAWFYVLSTNDVLKFVTGGRSLSRHWRWYLRLLQSSRRITQRIRRVGPHLSLLTQHSSALLGSICPRCRG